MRVKVALCHFGSRTRSPRILPSLTSLLCKMAGVTELTGALKSILARVDTPQEFEEWLKLENLLHPMDLYRLAADEAQVDEKIIQACKQSVPSVSELSVEVSIRKAWWLCRARMSVPPVEEEKEFDPSECPLLAAAWKNRCSIELTTRERVCKPLLKKLPQRTIPVSTF